MDSSSLRPKRSRANVKRLSYNHNSVSEKEIKIQRKSPTEMKNDPPLRDQITGRYLSRAEAQVVRGELLT